MISKIIERVLVPNDKFIYGYADLTGLTQFPYQEYNYGISIGRRLDNVIVDEIIDGPTLKYHSHYKEINKELQSLSEIIASKLRENGHEAVSVMPSVSTMELDGEYNKTLRTPLSHKMVATRAGLGWIGKTDLFISQKFGPRLRLVTILTKTTLVSQLAPINESQCGACQICVDDCPADAATGQAWDTSIDRDEFFDAQKCRKQCREFGENRLKSNIIICGICVSVCPIGL